MSPGRVLRVLLAAALLSAQHAALAHELWHASTLKSQPTQKQLCGQHDALGTVAGGLDSHVTPAVAETPADISCHVVVLPAAQSLGLAPSSRGPPASL